LVSKSRRRPIDSYKVISNRRLSANTYCLRTERPDVAIRAGQCFSVGTRDLGINREYSMYSAANDDFIDFLVRELPDGIVSPRLRECKPGDLVEIGGPYGDFCLPEQQIADEKYVFIATGTGIAPFHSFVKSFPTLQYTIFHGVRYEDERYDNYDYKSDYYIAAISSPTDGKTGMRITEKISTVNLDVSSIYYLCGNRLMITDAISILRDKGIPGGSIFTETFF
jgi:ferredoxin--NADP+ reductase